MNNSGIDTLPLLQEVAEAFPLGIVITDAVASIRYVNPAAQRITGYSAAELIGRTPAVFKSGQTPDEVYERCWAVIQSGDLWRGEFINRRKSGEIYLERKMIVSIRNDAGVIAYYMAIGEDLSHAFGDKLENDHLYVLDPLTGLPSRQAFHNILTPAIEEAKLAGRGVAVLHVDIDSFYRVNDLIGADLSDKIIIEIASRLKSVLRQSDHLARLRSDKFLMLISGEPGQVDADAGEVAERLLAAIRKPVQVVGRELEITASVGFACYPGDGETAAELLVHATHATEKAKALGGNEVCRFEQSVLGVRSEQLNLFNELRGAVERGEMVLHYQPQACLFSGEMIGLEALIRWQHPTRGMVPPGLFIPLAEQGSQIVHIGEWVIEEACRQMREWLDEGLPPVKVAINLAARHFRLASLHSTLANALARHAIDPSRLEIEITEGAMMHDVTAAIRTTSQLKALGLRLSLDDFGTGYSSLAYLSRFPIDVVKIDQSFVRDITTNPANAAIALATIAMSHKLGKRVLAEGVETEEQMHYLRRHECDEMQGYYLARPCPPADIARMLRDGFRLGLTAQDSLAGRHTLLFVDDEANVLSALRRTLRREGYEILTAESAVQGLSLMAMRPVEVVVSDQRMPEMNGTEFLERVKNLYPNTIRMVLSGYSEISAVTDAINKGAVYRFLLKPWDDEQLKEELRGALRYWRQLYGSPEGEDHDGS